MESGQVIQYGSYEDLLMSGTTFEQLINAHKNVVTQLSTSFNKQSREF